MEDEPNHIKVKIEQLLSLPPVPVIEAEIVTDNEKMIEYDITPYDTVTEYDTETSKTNVSEPYTVDTCENSDASDESDDYDDSSDSGDSHKYGDYSDSGIDDTDASGTNTYDTSDMKSKPGPKSKSKSKPGPKSKSKPGPKSKSKPGPKSKSKPGPKSKSKSNSPPQTIVKIESGIHAQNGYTSNHSNHEITDRKRSITDNEIRRSKRQRRALLENDVYGKQYIDIN